ncbi:MAG: hypothetical protein EA376_04695 [Phycisphaeraceae bacterium]|nr:MAG: hypothetical protein EA376_04695 [Phycisphaeraceae bacterium]
MARNSKRKSVKNKQKQERSWTWSGVGRRAGAIGAAALVIGALGGAVLGYAPLKERVGALRADPLVVKFEWPPLAGHKRAGDVSPPATWLPEGERWRLEQAVRATVSPDPFDLESLDRARATLLATGWFANELELQRRPGGVIDVRGVWRTPAAVVRWEGADRLVSRDGRLLRLTYPPGEAGSLRIITGTWAGPPPSERGGLDYGATWLGGDVQAAIKLLETIRATSAWPHVSGVDVSAYLNRGRLAIITRDGARLVWGASPGEAAPGEQPDDVKLARLTTLIDDPAWINAGRPNADLYTPYVLIDETAVREQR